MSLSQVENYNPSASSTFGDTIVAELRPIVTLKATYGILDECQTFTATGGSAAATNGEFVMQTGTSVGGYGVIWSRQPVVYVPGVGSEARLTARFTTGVANGLQLAGYFTAVDGMFFGYNGTRFGVMHRHGGAIEIRTLTVTAGSGGAATVTVTLNGVAYTAPVTSGSVQLNAHEIEQALNAGAAANLWYIQHINDTVIFVSKDAAPKAGTYSVSVSTGTFAGNIAQNRAGAAPAEDWTYQSDWLIDKAPWFDPTKGNLFKMEYAYLGYGPLKFSIFNPGANKWQQVHVINWTNSNAGVNFGNPSLRCGWASASLGSTTNLTVAGASAMAGLQGRANRAHAFGVSGTATGVSTTQTQVLTIQVRREFGDRAAVCVIVPKTLSISTDATKGAIFNLYRNPVVAGNTVHTYVDETQSACTYDTAGTTVSGGRILGSYSIGPAGRATINLTDINDVLISGDELVITAAITSGPVSEMTASLVWDEII